MRSVNRIVPGLCLSLAGMLIAGLLSVGFAFEGLDTKADPTFDALGKEIGLSNLSVSSIVQDRDGFLWFGTQGGLNRYNGRDMTTFRNDPFVSDGLIHNLIQTMMYDEETHELWIGTYQGISRLDIGESRFINYSVEDNGLSNPVVTAMAFDNSKDIWVGTLDGLNRIDGETNAVETFDVPGDVVRSLYLASDGKLYLGSYKGLYEVIEGNLKKVPITLSSPNVMTIDEFDGGVLTLGLWGGSLTQVDLRTYATETIALSDDRIYAVEETDAGALWVGTWGGGLFRIGSEGTVDHYPGNRENGYGHPVAYALYEDASGILWIGSNGGGLYSINPRKQNYTILKNDPEVPNSLPMGKVNALYEDSEGYLWIAVYNSGLHRYDPLSGLLQRFQYDAGDDRSLPSDQVTVILEWKGQMLVGTNKGLASYNPQSMDFEKLPFVPEETLVYALAKDKQDGLWIGTYHQGAFYYSPQGRLSQYAAGEEADYPLSDNLVYSILVDSHDRVWIGTNNGLNRVEPSNHSVQQYRRNGDDRAQLANNTIRSLYQDSEENIWIGMVGGGLARYVEKTNQFVSFTEADGLSGNVVTGILEDEQRSLWLATHNGLTVLPDEGNTPFRLTTEDGIGGEEFTGGALRYREEYLVFGGNHGVTFIPHGLARTNPIKPMLYITDVRTYDESVSPDRVRLNGEHMVFAPEENSLGFDFVALDYDSPDKLHYRYRLIGLDEEWINAGTRYYASYSNLPPGHYRFEVAARTVHDVVSDTAFVSFEIASPWYSTPAAYLIYIILASLLAFMLFKVREGRLIHQRNAELSQLNERLEKANAQLEMLSTTDMLTGLFNRHYFDTIAEELLFLARRSQSYFSLLMIDIDGFKRINDTYGHLAGDDYLRDVGEMIQADLPRSTDFAARYGGDEFVVVLYDTPPKGAMRVAEKLMKGGEQIAVRTEKSSERITTSLSIGCDSRIPDQHATVKGYLNRADQALYKAKSDPTNKVIIDGSGKERDTEK